MENKLKILKSKAEQNLLSGKGGGFFIKPERPRVVVKKNDEIVYNSTTVNYAILKRVIYRALLLGKASDKEGDASVKVIFAESGDVIFSFLKNDPKGLSQGALALNPFKFEGLMAILNQMVNTVSIHQEIFKTKDGRPIKLTRVNERVFFPYERVQIELPLADRVLLVNSLIHYIHKKELRPYLGILSKAENTEEGSFVVLGINDYRIPVTEENIPNLLAIL